MVTKLMVIVAVALMLSFGFTTQVQAFSGEAEAAIGAAEAVQLTCPDEPRGDRIGPRDGSGGENAPRDGRGSRRGRGRGDRDGSGQGRGEGRGDRDGSGRGRGHQRGARDGSGPNCPN